MRRTNKKEAIATSFNRQFVAIRAIYQTVFSMKGVDDVFTNLQEYGNNEDFREFIQDIVKKSLTSWGDDDDLLSPQVDEFVSGVLLYTVGRLSIIEEKEQDKFVSGDNDYPIFNLGVVFTKLFSQIQEIDGASSNADLAMVKTKKRLQKLVENHDFRELLKGFAEQAETLRRNIVRTLIVLYPDKFILGESPDFMSLEQALDRIPIKNRELNTRKTLLKVLIEAFKRCIQFLSKGMSSFTMNIHLLSVLNCSLHEEGLSKDDDLINRNSLYSRYIENFERLRQSVKAVLISGDLQRYANMKNLLKAMISDFQEMVEKYSTLLHRSIPSAVSLLEDIDEIKKMVQLFESVEEKILSGQSQSMRMFSSSSSEGERGEGVPQQHTGSNDKMERTRIIETIKSSLVSSELLTVERAYELIQLNQQRMLLEKKINQVESNEQQEQTRLKR